MNDFLAAVGSVQLAVEWAISFSGVNKQPKFIVNPVLPHTWTPALFKTLNNNIFQSTFVIFQLPLSLPCK